MPQLFAPGDFVQLRVYCSAGNQVAVNVFHYYCEGISGGSASDTAFAAAVADALPGLYKDVMSEHARYEGIQVQIIAPVRRPEVSNITGNAVGAVTGDLMPPQTCGLLSLRTGVASRSKRGRLYIPFPPETRNGSDGKPSLTQLGDYGDLADFFTTEIVAGTLPDTATLTPVVLSRVNGTPENIDTILVRSAWATQRRRSFLRKPDVLPF